jgi:hypothetical protein
VSTHRNLLPRYMLLQRMVSLFSQQLDTLHRLHRAFHVPQLPAQGPRGPGACQGPQANDAVQQIGQLLKACSLSAQTQQPQASLTPPQQHGEHLHPHPRNPQQLPEHGAHDWQLHPGRPPGDAARRGGPVQQQHDGQQVDSITAGLRDTMLGQRPPELQMVRAMQRL